jgi:hypothetical protein
MLLPTVSLSVLLLATQAQAQTASATPTLSRTQNPMIQPQKPNGLNVKKPNMIIFMPDQLRYDSVGFTGNDVGTKPPPA